MKYTIITGNPIDGFECAGLFDSEPEAITCAEVEYDHQDWWIMPIRPIEP